MTCFGLFSDLCCANLWVEFVFWIAFVVLMEQASAGQTSNFLSKAITLCVNTP